MYKHKFLGSYADYKPLPSVSGMDKNKQLNLYYEGRIEFKSNYFDNWKKKNEQKQDYDEKISGRIKSSCFIFLLLFALIAQILFKSFKVMNFWEKEGLSAAIGLLIGVVFGFIWGNYFTPDKVKKQNP